MGVRYCGVVLEESETEVGFSEGDLATVVL